MQRLNALPEMHKGSSLQLSGGKIVHCRDAVKLTTESFWRKSSVNPAPLPYRTRINADKTDLDGLYP